MKTCLKKCMIKVFRVALSIGLLLVGCMHIALAQNQGEGFPLSLNSMILFALHENPDIEIFRARKDQSHFSVKEKQADFYPEISLRAEGGRAYNKPGAGVTTPGASAINNSGEINLSIEQLLFDGFRTKNEVDNRKKLEEASEFRTESAIEEIINETVENYLKVLRYQREIEINQNLLASITATLKTIKDQFEAGATGKVMLDYAKARQAYATTELNRAQSSLNDAISNLEFLAGKLPDDFTAIPPEELSPDKIDLQYYLEVIEDKNSKVLASVTEIDAMEHLLDAEKGKYFPTVTFNALASQKHNDGGPIGSEREISGMFRMNYQIFDGFKRKAAKSRIESQIEELDQKRLQILKEVRRDVKLAYNQVQANDYALALTEQEIESNIAQKKLNEENFKSGEINVIELIESAERLKDAYLKKEKLNYEMHFNAYKLLVFTGVLEREFFCETCMIKNKI